MTEELEPVPDLIFKEVKYNKRPYQQLLPRLEKFSWDMDCPHGDNIERFFFLFPELIGLAFPIACCHSDYTAPVYTEYIIESYVKPLSSHEMCKGKFIFALIECSSNLEP